MLPLCVIKSKTLQNMTTKEWYTAKTIYSVNQKTVKDAMKLYEERVVLIKATSFDEAILVAEKEANNYADKNDMKYLKYVNVFKLYEKRIKHKTEVFSLMRHSKLAPNKYIDKHFDTGKERTSH